MSEIALLNEISQNVTIQQENSIEREDLSATTSKLGTILPTFLKKEALKTLIPFSSISPFLHFDSSSVHPNFYSRTETSFQENKLLGKFKSTDILQNEIIFRMPPMSKTSITVRIRKVEKAEPRIFKPEEI